MNELARAASFFFDENFGQGIRIVEQNRERWFVAKDVCNILGIKNVRKAVADFPENEKQIININTVANSYGINKSAGNPNVNIINEAGLYRLVFKSRKPEAKRFQTWVFEEVLPSIRKHGHMAKKRI